MSKLLRFSYSLAVVVCLLSEPLAAAEGVNGNLADVRWLEKNLKSADLVLLDCSGAPVYAAKHIPGAINAEQYSYALSGTPPARLEKLFQSWGISPGKKILMYDEGGTIQATRLFFSLYSSGFSPKDLLILDGGLFKWQQAGLPVTRDFTPAPKPGTFRIERVIRDAQAELPEVLAASGDTAGSALIEALGPDWHFGAVQPFERAGHIPNGIMWPSADFYNPDKTFKAPEEIRRMLAYLGVKPQQRIYTYCGGGIAASVPYFALKFILNYPNVKLYTESELGWLRDDRGLPYWTYDAPYLMRESSWLQFWGIRIRAMLESRVNIVDVRPVEAFNQGHLPSALNIPAEAFRSNIADPGKLAELVGAAGVSVSNEAVVVSGAGLNRESALAFVMLEKLGQKRVSLFLEPADKWAQLGFAVTKDAPAGRPGSYPAIGRKDTIITGPETTRGVYPKVFIASGRDLPPKARDGKVVHVPFTELLNADGRPKAAKDIWNVLSKAGLPRYAELICISEDPGEAAVNYFILKLMGFPDVKVMLI
jgi:thiosulfate/3-mercaptopyruvate sulfurtransferase